MTIREDIPRRICTDARMKRLREFGIKTNGYDRSLEKILKKIGYMNPVLEYLNDEPYYGYCINGNLQYWLNYTDALAEKILYIYDNGIQRRNV